MHIPIGLVIAAIVLYLLHNWWQERKRIRNLRRTMTMLYPQADPAHLRKYVQDVYGRR